MGKKRRILFAILAVAVLCVLAWMMLRPATPEPEPVYQGKPLSAWLEFYDPANPNKSNAQMGVAQAAIIQIGTNAIPALLQMLRTPDLPWKNRLFALAQKQHFIKIKYIEPFRTYEMAAMGLEVLGPRATDAVPELMKIFDQNPSPQCRAAIARVVGLMGPEAKAAVPSLLRGATNADGVTRGNSLWALGRIHAEPELTIPVFINGLHDTDLGVQLSAASGLGTFGPAAKAAVPALVKYIETKQQPSNQAYIGPPPKYMAWRSLHDIDPEAASKLSTNLDQNVK